MSTMSKNGSIMHKDKIARKLICMESHIFTRKKKYYKKRKQTNKKKIIIKSNLPKIKVRGNSVSKNS